MGTQRSIPVTLNCYEYRVARLLVGPHTWTSILILNGPPPPRFNHVTPPILCVVASMAKIRTGPVIKSMSIHDLNSCSSWDNKIAVSTGCIGGDCQGSSIGIQHENVNVESQILKYKSSWNLLPLEMLVLQSRFSQGCLLPTIDKHAEMWILWIKKAKRSFSSLQ